MKSTPDTPEIGNGIIQLKRWHSPLGRKGLSKRDVGGSENQIHVFQTISLQVLCKQKNSTEQIAVIILKRRKDKLTTCEYNTNSVFLCLFMSHNTAIL